MQLGRRLDFKVLEEVEEELNTSQRFIMNHCPEIAEKPLLTVKLPSWRPQLSAFKSEC